MNYYEIMKVALVCCVVVTFLATLGLCRSLLNVAIITLAVLDFSVAVLLGSTVYCMSQPVYEEMEGTAEASIAVQNVYEDDGKVFYTDVASGKVMQVSGSAVSIESSDPTVVYRYSIVGYRGLHNFYVDCAPVTAILVFR